MRYLKDAKRHERKKNNKKQKKPENYNCHIFPFKGFNGYLMLTEDTFR